MNRARGPSARSSVYSPGPASNISSAMTDPDHDALLRAIVRHADDDTPRLVDADWLEENGRGEEGEFVRVQCRLASAEPDDPEYPALTDREEELRTWLGTHAPGPRPTVPGGLSVEGGNRWWTYTYRGFPRFLEFDGYERYGAKAMRALASAVERAFDVLPTRWLVVRYITLAQLRALLKYPVLAGLSHLTVQLSATEDGDGAARLLAGCRHLRHLRGLSLAFGFGEAGCAALAAAPWGGLEWFSPTCHEITPAGVRALSGAEWFRNARELRLNHGLPDGSFDALARLPAFPRLHSLDLTQTAFSEPAWQTFARSRAFPALGRLQLSYSELSGGQFDALAACTSGLRVLGLRSCGLPPGTGAALAAAPWAAALRSLDLSNNGLPAADVKAIASCRAFGELRHLRLSNNTLAPTVLSALTANPALRGLRELHLDGYTATGLTPAHFERFLTKLDMPDLRYLELSGRPLGARATRRFTDPKFASLTRLHLNDCKLSDAAVKALVTAPALRNLLTLGLDNNKLTTGPEPLADRAVLPKLAACGLSSNAISAATKRKLRRRPDVRL